jgi:hypothetical protein
MYTNASERLRIDTSGNVGIGTSSPVGGYRLNVVNDSGNSQQLIRAGTNFNSTIAFGDQDSSTSGQLIYAHNGDFMAFNTNAAERMRIDSSGNVGIGTSSPDHPLTVKKSFASDWVAKFTNESATGVSGFGFYNNSDTWKGYVGYDNGDVDFLKLFGATGVGIKFLTANTERMRIDSSGRLFVGVTTTTFSSSEILEVNGSVGFVTATGNTNLFCANSGTGSQTYVAFYTGTTGTNTGNITTNGTITVYGTTSDKRLKTNIIDAPSGNIDNIKVRSFDWLSDKSHQEYGMVAQELIEVAPYAVHQPQNDTEMMTVDYSLLVPMMIKEIQDLKQRIATLENK